MANTFFYNADITHDADSVILHEDTSRHIVQVLRMSVGEKINLTNGKGSLFVSQITDNNKKAVKVNILEHIYNEQRNKISIAISPVKNTSRFEWFVEKATEIGICQIVPLICKRTEKQHFRSDRIKTIIISAMIQSQQTWMPDIAEPVKFSDVINRKLSSDQVGLIAHCEDGQERKIISSSFNNLHPFILIGPEGDFTGDEIQSALKQNYIPVTLGNTRLRTETAGIVAVTLLNH